MQKKEFRLHKAALYSIIQAQAGTFEKALLELVMNAVDAGSTNVTVKLTNNIFSVSDDGRGFVGLDEIEHYFATFGTPHTEGDAIYGRFRMGRGQIMSFSKQIWRSNDFRMTVDIKNDGDNYGFEQGLPMHKGCLIEGEMYEPLSTADLLAVQRNLAEMCQYVGIEVIVNGKCVSRKHLDQKWTMEDDNAYYLLNPGRDRLAIYNLGVLVKETWASDLGLGGVVLSKKQLTVNLARNDVLVSKCPVWKEIAKAVRARFGEENRSNRIVKNETWRTSMARKFLAGQYDMEDDAAKLVCDEKVFTTIDGKNKSLMDLADMTGLLYARGARKQIPLLIASDDGSVRADKAHKTEFAIVLSAKVSNRFGANLTLAEIFDTIAAGLNEHFKRPNRSKDWTQSRALELLRHLRELARSESYLEEFKDDLHTSVPDCDLKKEQLAILNAIRETQCHLLRWSHESEHIKPRELMAGTCEGAHAWTDGHSRIWINVERLRFSGNGAEQLFMFASRIGSLLLHEYTHDSDDRQTAVHALEFYEKFESLVCDSSRLGVFAFRFIRAWLRRKAKLQAGTTKNVLRRGETEALDLLEQSGDDLTDITTDDADPQATHKAA